MGLPWPGILDFISKPYISLKNNHEKYKFHVYTIVPNIHRDNDIKLLDMKDFAIKIIMNYSIDVLKIGLACHGHYNFQIIVKTCLLHFFLSFSLEHIFMK